MATLFGGLVLAFANVAPFVAAALLERWHPHGALRGVAMALIGVALATWARLWVNAWADFSTQSETFARLRRGPSASWFVRVWSRGKQAACGIAFVVIGNAICLVVASPLLALLFPMSRPT